MLSEEKKDRLLELLDELNHVLGKADDMSLDYQDPEQYQKWQIDEDTEVVHWQLFTSTVTVDEYHIRIIWPVEDTSNEGEIDEIEFNDML